MGSSEVLQDIAFACATCADKLLDVKDDSSYVLKKITLPGGKTSFRFTQTLLVNGETIEIQVRKILKK